MRRLRPVEGVDGAAHRLRECGLTLNFVPTNATRHYVQGSERKLKRKIGEANANGALAKYRNRDELTLPLALSSAIVRSIPRARGRSDMPLRSGSAKSAGEW